MPKFHIVPTTEVPQRKVASREAAVRAEYVGYIDKIGRTHAGKLTPSEGETTQALRRRLGAAAKHTGKSWSSSATARTSTSGASRAAGRRRRAGGRSSGARRSGPGFRPWGGRPCRCPSPGSGSRACISASWRGWSGPAGPGPRAGPPRPPAGAWRTSGAACGCVRPTSAPPWRRSAYLLLDAPLRQPAAVAVQE